MVPIQALRWYRYKRYDGTVSPILSPNLTTVTVPSTVTSIGSSAFGNDTKLTHVIIEATTPPAFSSYAFHPSFVEELKVPAQSVDAYKAASGWSAFGDKIIAM